MSNFDIEKINQSINDAYDEQSEKVKELLQTAKENLAVDKPAYDYKGNKKDLKYMQFISRSITRKKQEESSLQEKIDTKFDEMQDKLNINSKNLDIIFENVAQNNQKEFDILQAIRDLSLDSNTILQKNILEEQKKISSSILQTQNVLTNELSKVQNVIEKKIDDIEVKTDIEPKLQEIQDALTQKIEEKQMQIDITPELEDTKNAIIQKIQEKQIQIDITPELENAKNSIYKKIENTQKVLEQKIDNMSMPTIPQQVDVDLEKTQNVLSEKIEQTQDALEKKIDKIQTINSFNIPIEQWQAQNNKLLLQIKQEISQKYQEDSKYVINSLIQEKNTYIKAIEERDKEIRYLNDRIYNCEEKLQKEIEKRHRASIFAAFFGKQEVQEEEPTAKSQILNFGY